MQMKCHENRTAVSSGRGLTTALLNGQISQEALNLYVGSSSAQTRFQDLLCYSLWDSPVAPCKSSQGLVRYVEKPGEGEGEARTSQTPCRAIRVVLAWYAHDRTLITARS